MSTQLLVSSLRLSLSLATEMVFLVCPRIIRSREMPGGGTGFDFFPKVRDVQEYRQIVPWVLDEVRETHDATGRCCLEIGAASERIVNLRVNFNFR